MKAIRYFASLLMLITGVLHFFPMFSEPRDPNALPMLAFGIVFFGIGVLLLLRIRLSEIFGILFPLIGLGTCFFVVGMKNWDTMIHIMAIIDVIVIICCILLLWNRKRFNDTSH